MKIKNVSESTVLLTLSNEIKLLNPNEELVLDRDLTKVESDSIDSLVKDKKLSIDVEVEKIITSDSTEKDDVVPPTPIIPLEIKLSIDKTEFKVGESSKVTTNVIPEKSNQDVILSLSNNDLGKIDKGIFTASKLGELELIASKVIDKKNTLTTKIKLVIKE